MLLNGYVAVQKPLMEDVVPDPSKSFEFEPETCHFCKAQDIEDKVFDCLPCEIEAFSLCLSGESIPRGVSSTVVILMGGP